MKRNAKQNPMRCNVESIRLATIKQTNNNKYSKQFRKLKPLCIVGGKNGEVTMKNSMDVSKHNNGITI